MRKSVQSYLVLLGCLAMSAYFTQHAINGRYGLEAQSRLVERSAELTREIKSLEAVHARLRRHVRLLSDEPPAADLVEEIARRDLGFAFPQDIIIQQ